ncbi:oxygenase MpaB family protein [Rhodococcus daqingensis]|uniref:Oxygenase MpaB family protein n=1 Tax=Rhodococcus daqingensis TaxID=2479363 RepID=A0ABW2RXJ8_9NOCA
MTVTTTGTDRFEDMIDGVSVMAGAANVIMQLARPGVGYGVVESTVESGQIFRHPIKRTRTTLTYLAVVGLGSDDERLAYRQEVNRAHRQVRSGPDSPVQYNAFDPELQLWVAACLYRGFVDTHLALHGPMADDEADEFYRQAARLGTTLQVKEGMWPSDRAAFDRYWEESLAKVSIDDTVRRYLYRIASAEFFPRPVGLLLGPLNRFITAGFLPQQFRDEMQMSWDARDQRRFDAMMSVVARVNGFMPRIVRLFPFNVYMWDLRRRLRTGRPAV